uniref:NB-ARC domain-containing protein n=1 Tax=Oryza brachyantha TaxID=4533 RepID=J3ND83_ORYBR
MRRILSLSFYDLPSNLKTCFLYLSVYPEDSEIKVDELIWTWAAEGFIHVKHGQGIRELGHSYFIELINRSMIQPAYILRDGRIWTCRVHDMVLDLIRALSVDENFVTILDDEQYKPLPKKMRRLSIQKSNSDDKVRYPTMSFSQIRSLAAFSHINQVPSLKIFHVLRVLNLRRCEYIENCHLHVLVHLVHLRYVGLGSTRITDLPEQIRNLQFLQTLNVRCPQIRQLPAGIIELTRLIRLHVDFPVLLPDGFGNMRCLQELSSQCDDSGGGGCRGCHQERSRNPSQPSQTFDG